MGSVGVAEPGVSPCSSPRSLADLGERLFFLLASVMWG